MTDQQNDKAANLSSIANTQEGLSKLVDATIPHELDSTMQQVDNVMLQSQQAIQQSLHQSAQLIASAGQHLQQGLSPTAGNEQPQEQPAPPENALQQEHSSSVNQAQQQNQLIQQQMQAAIEQVQKSVHQTSEHMQQANTAREQALTQLVQGQQANQQQAESTTPPSTDQAENSTVPDSHSSTPPSDPS